MNYWQLFCFTLSLRKRKDSDHENANYSIHICFNIIRWNALKR